MKLLILFYLLHPIDIDHHVQLQRATFIAEDHFVETIEERIRITKKREAFEKLLTLINQ